MTAFLASGCLLPQKNVLIYDEGVSKVPRQAAAAVLVKEEDFVELAAAGGRIVGRYLLNEDQRMKGRSRDLDPSKDEASLVSTHMIFGALRVAKRGGTHFIVYYEAYSRNRQSEFSSSYRAHAEQQWLVFHVPQKNWSSLPERLRPKVYDAKDKKLELLDKVLGGDS